MGNSDLAHTRDDWWWRYEGLEEEEERLGVEGSFELGSVLAYTDLQAPFVIVACFPHLGRVHDPLRVWF